MTLEEAKLFLKVDFDEDDDLIEMLVAAAAEDCEAYCNAAFRPRTYEMTLAAFPYSCKFGPKIFLPRHPLVSVPSDGLVYLDSDGDEQTVDTADYIVSAGHRQPFITPASGFSWPCTYEHPAAVTLTFRAGFEDEIPRGIQAAVRFRLSQLYRNRDEAELAMPESSKSGLASWRLHPLP